MKKIVKTFLIGSLIGLYFSLYFIGLGSDVYFSDIVIKCAFGVHDISYHEIINISMELFSILILVFLYGNDIYKRFCIASVYFFSRCTNRIRWFVKESIVLFINVFLYVLIIPTSCMIIACINNNIIFDIGSIGLCIYYLLIYTFYLYSIVLGTNILAIKLGSVKGFSIITIFLLSSVTLVTLWEKIFPLVISDEVTLEMVMKNGELLKFNPITHLILKWHTSIIPEINEKIGFFLIEYDLNCSLITSVILFFTIYLVSVFVIKRLDLVMLCKEMED